MGHRQNEQAARAVEPGAAGRDELTEERTRVRVIHQDVIVALAGEIENPIVELSVMGVIEPTGTRGDKRAEKISRARIISKHGAGSRGNDHEHVITKNGVARAIESTASFGDEYIQKIAGLAVVSKHLIIVVTRHVEMAVRPPRSDSRRRGDEMGISSQRWVLLSK